MDSLPDKLPLWMTEQNKADPGGDKEKNPFQMSVLEDSLPFLEYHGSVIYSYNANDCSLLSEDILTTLPIGAVVGFDIEWPAVYTKGKEGKIALIQLCESETKCYLFHISSMSSFPTGLKKLLEDNRIKKAGVGIEGDKWKLLRDFEVRLHNFVDLADLSNEKLKCKEKWSLNGLVKHLFHKQLMKDNVIRCGDWKQFPLTEKQKQYAATDAYAGFLIYQKLINLSSDKRMQLCVKRDGNLLSKIKNELTSLSKEMLDMADCLPATFEQITNVQSATEILADISENIKALKQALCINSNWQAELEESVDLGEKSDNEEKAEISELVLKSICHSNDYLDHSIVNAQNKALTKDEELSKKEQKDDATDTGLKEVTEKEFFMSLDITEYELQMMERQAEEEMLHEKTCMYEDLSFETDEENHPCIMENDDELEKEMIKLLEDINKSNLNCMNSNLDNLEKKNDLKGEDQGEQGREDDEGIEEEEESWDSCLIQPNTKEIACLKMYFGHSSFKPVQWKVISSVLQERRDNLVVMATGYGKSLCFQFPPVFTGGIGLVISPLISLMEDQVLQLTMSGIQACLLGSAQTKNIREEIKMGLYRVVYLTPEFCSGNHLWLKQLNDDVGITLIAIDEAHCVSEWGHDFRQSFRCLNLLKKILPKVPIVALTATASPSIRKDIIDCLNLKDPQITCTSFDRPNLYLEVIKKSGNVKQDLLQFLIQNDKYTYEFEGPTIVYCPSRKITMEVASILTKLNVVCGTYHAGMNIKERREVHHRFMRDEIQCIVATVAFGLGINKADIRTIIHYGAPKDMESYYQEIGRAGRDGLSASCYVLWSPGDMCLNRFLISKIRDEKFQLYKLKMMAKIEKYLSLNSCRRKIILSHFEDKQLRKASLGIMGTEKCCDNCRSRNVHGAPVVDVNDTFEDFGPQAYKLLSAISVLKEKFGLGVPIMFLRGTTSSRLPDRFRTHELFGCGKDWPNKSWKALGQRLIFEGFLKFIPAHTYSTACILTNKGNNWLSKARKEPGQSLLLQPDAELCLKKTTRSYQQTSSEMGHSSSTMLQKTSLHEMFSFQETNKMPRGIMLSNKSSNTTVQLPLSVAPQTTTKSIISEKEMELQTVLYGKLMAARQKLASEKDIPPAILATNKILVDMTVIRPTSVEVLNKIDGISEAKSTMLAPILTTIKEFCQANNLQTDIFKTSEVKDQPDIAIQKNSGHGILTESQRITYTLFQDKNMSLRAISASRSLPLTVIGTHLSQALKAGYQVSLARAGLTPEIQEMITNIIRNPPINSDITQMQAIRTLVPASIDMYLIQMTTALLAKQPSSQQLNQNDDSDNQGPSQMSGFLQSSTTSSQKKEEKILWIETKGDTVKPPMQKANSESCGKQNATCTDSLSSIQNSNEKQVLSAKQDILNCQSAIKLASWNQHPVNAEEDLFTDSQSELLSQPSKRKLPDWFGASEEVPRVKISKKPKGGNKGLFS